MIRRFEFVIDGKTFNWTEPLSLSKDNLAHWDEARFADVISGSDFSNFNRSNIYPHIVIPENDLYRMGVRDVLEALTASADCMMVEFALLWHISIITKEVHVHAPH